MNGIFGTIMITCPCLRSLRFQYCVILILSSKPAAVVDVRNPTIEVVPAPTRGSSDYCERVFVNGVSRNILGSFAKIYLRFIPTLISRDWHDKAQICIHGYSKESFKFYPYAFIGNRWQHVQKHARFCF